MRRSLAILVLLMCPPARARADEPVFVDSLVPQRIPVTSFRHMGRQGFNAERSDSLTGLALRIVEGWTRWKAPAARTSTRRSRSPAALAHVAFVPPGPGGQHAVVRGRPLVHADLLCRYSLTEDESPVELVLHDRVALVGIGPERTCVYLLPAGACTIHDEGHCGQSTRSAPFRAGTMCWSRSDAP